MTVDAQAKWQSLTAVSPEGLVSISGWTLLSPKTGRFQVHTHAMLLCTYEESYDDRD